MATIVIVHGAFQGGWLWKAVRQGLEAAGHEVYTPTLTGLGERTHLASPAIDLDTHLQDIVNVLEYEDLHDVVLVGHSYGGVVAILVADRIPERLARVIHVDTLLPRDGECAFDLFLPEDREEWEERARVGGDGWRVPPIAGGDARRSPLPLKTLQQPVRLVRAGGSAIPASYVYCTIKPQPDLDDLSVRRARELGWPVFELAAQHSPQRSHPRELTELLLQII